MAVMSLLGHLVPGWHPERAATIALAHILDPEASPGMASAFVDLVGETGSLNFEPHRVVPDLDQNDDSLPDVTIYDAAEKPRVFVEATFWEGVPAAQPVGYLHKLPGDLPSALVYIAPRKRIGSLWEILHERCAGDPEIEVEDEHPTDDAVRARVGPRVLLVTSWAYVLETLQRVAENPAVEQDIVQLRSLAKRLETAAFLPLERDEAADAALARRLLCYRDLVHRIARRLEKEGLATNVKYSQPSYRKQRDEGCAMRLHGKFELRFGIELGAWRDSGVTPLWCVLTGSESFSTLGNWLRVKQRFDGVRSYGDGLYIPVRLKTGVDEAAVIDDGVDRMRGIADVLLDVSRNRRASRPAPSARRSVLAEVIPRVMQREPAATQALHYILEASSDLAGRSSSCWRAGGSKSEESEASGSTRRGSGRIWRFTTRGDLPDVRGEQARCGADLQAARRLSRRASAAPRVGARLHRAGGPDRGSLERAEGRMPLREAQAHGGVFFRRPSPEPGRQPYHVDSRAGGAYSRRCRRPRRRAVSRPSNRNPPTAQPCGTVKSDDD